MIHNCRRMLFATALATAFILSSGHGAALPPFSIPEFIQDSDNHVTYVAKRSKKSARSASSVSISNIRFHAHKTYTRVVLDMVRQPSVSERKNSKHKRMTFQLKKARLSQKARKRLKNKEFPSGIEIGEGSNQTVSITLDLAVIDKYKFHKLRKPNRFVVDLYYSRKAKHSPVSVTNKQPSKADITKPGTPSIEGKRLSQDSKKNSSSFTPPQSATMPPTNTRSTPTAVAASLPPKLLKDFLVVIDPGHGGKDPGAIGAKGTREKEVTLKIAKVLQDYIQRRMGTKVFLTRSTDVFLDLEDRVAFANNKKADLFISIHVNSHSMKSIKGLEVYHFGKASDPRALQVAARENGITLADDTPPWQFIIADKLNDQKIEESQTFAWTTRKILLSTLKKQFSVKDHGVKTAPFYVLRFTTMPSILMEVAFVSNPTEEIRLRSRKYQKSLAEGMYKGIYAYLQASYPGIS